MEEYRQMKNRYRIVQDNFMGYEVQIRRWWWPFWQEWGHNTFHTIEKAEAWAKSRKQPIVKYLGTLDDD